MKKVHLQLLAHLTNECRERQSPLNFKQLCTIPQHILELYSARDKVPFMEIIRQNPLNTSGKSAKTQRQSWGTRTKPTHSFFARRGHMLGNQHRAAAFQI